MTRGAVVALLVALVAPLPAAEALGSAVAIYGSYQFVPDILDLVRNGGGEAGQQDAVFGWERRAPSADAESVLTRDEARAAAGRSSLRIAQPDARQPARWLQEIGAPASDLQWRVSAQICGALGPDSRAYVLCCSADGPQTLAELSAGDLSPEWKEYGAQLPIPPGLDRLSLALGIEGTGEVWFDDVRVVPTGAAVDAADDVELLMPLPPAGQGQQRLALQTILAPPAPEASGAIETTHDGIEVVRLTIGRDQPLMWVRCVTLVLVAAREAGESLADPQIAPVADPPADVAPFCSTAYLAIPDGQDNRDRLEQIAATETYSALARCCADMLCHGRRPSVVEGTSRWKDVDGYALRPMEFVAAACRLRGVPARVVTVARALPPTGTADDVTTSVVQRAEIWTPAAGWVPFPDTANKGKGSMWTVLGVLRPGKEAQPDPLREGRPMLMLAGKAVSAPLMDRGEAMAGWWAANAGGPVLTDADVRALAAKAAGWWQRAKDGFIPGQIPVPVWVAACQRLERSTTAEELIANLGE